MKKKFSNMTIATLTKSLVINIVANNLSGCDNIVIIFLSDGFLSSSISSISVEEREKRAISDPDTKADANNNTPASNNATKASNPGADNVTPGINASDCKAVKISI